MRVANLDGRHVLVDDDRCLDVERASNGRFPPAPLGCLERWGEFRDWAATVVEGDWRPIERERLGPPVPSPRQVFALAVNYKDHAAEAGIEPPDYPLVFTKYPTCLTGPFDDVILPSNRADWEVELVVVIGPAAERVDESDAWDHVAGVTIGQDISERRVQFRKPHPHLSMAKSYPTFGPTGPLLVTPDEFIDSDDLAIACRINGELMQDSRTAQLIFSVPALVSSISAIVPLLPGDLIFTGTPAGVGSTRDPRRYLEPGDVIESEIEGIGVMSNRCVEATSPRD